MKKVIVLCSLLLISGIFSVLSGIFPYFGIAGLIIGTAISIYSLAKSYLQNRELNDFLEAQNIINMKNKSGNLYYEAFKKKTERKLTKKGKAKVDIKLLRKAYISNPSDEETLLAYSAIEVLRIELDAYVKGKLDRTALNKFKRELERLIKKRASGLAYSTLGVIADLEKKFKHARDCFRKAGKLNFPLWRLHLATSYEFTAQFNQAFMLLIEELGGGNKSWMTYFALGRVYSDLEEYKRSIHCLNKAYRLRGNKIELLYSLYLCNLKLGKLYKSSYFQIKYCLILILSGYTIGFPLIFPSLFILFLNVVQSLSRAVWIITSMIPPVKKIHLKIYSPMNNYYQTASTMLEFEEYKAAISLFEKCAKYYDNEPEYFMKLGIAYAMTSNRKSALVKMEKAIKLDKENFIYNHNYEAVKKKAKLKFKTYSDPKSMERMIIKSRKSYHK